MDFGIFCLQLSPIRNNEDIEILLSGHTNSEYSELRDNEQSTENIECDDELDQFNLIKAYENNDKPNVPVHDEISTTKKPYGDEMDNINEENINNNQKQQENEPNINTENQELLKNGSVNVTNVTIVEQVKKNILEFFA